MIEMNPAMVIPSKMWCYKWDWGYLTVLITSRQAIWDADWGGVEWMVEKMDVSTGLLQMGGCSWSWGLRDDLSPPLPLKLNINTGEPTTDRNVNYCTLVPGGNNTCNRMWLCISSGRYFKGRVSQFVCTLSFQVDIIWCWLGRLGLIVRPDQVSYLSQKCLNRPVQNM